jgi:hypothetical protein
MIKILRWVLLSLVLSSPVFAGSMLLLGAGSSGGGGGGGGCSQATTFLARNGGANSAATTAFVCGGVTDGWWPKWDVLYIHATDTSAHALLNWTSSSFTGALVATNPTFTANQGFTGNASGVVDTTFVPSSGVNYTLNSASTFVCILSNNGSAQVDFGAAGFTSGTSVTIFEPGTSAVAFDINDAGGGSLSGGPGLVAGSFFGNRTSSTNIDVFFGPGSTKLGSITETSTFVNSSNSFYELAFHNTGTASNPTTDQIAAFGAGGGFTATDWSNFQARLHTYMVAVNGSGC